MIKIGGIQPLSGGLSLIGKPADQAARAYFRYINDSGGLNGFKFEYIVEDDSGDASRTRAAAEKLVERDQIFAMGPSFTPYSPDLVTFLQSKGVPFLGWDGLNDKGFASPTTVTLSASVAQIVGGLFPYWTKASGIRKIGVIYTEFGPGVSYRDETRRLCARIGCQIVKEQPVNQQTNAFVPILLDMQRAGVEGIALWNAPDVMVKILIQAREMKYKPAPGGFVGVHAAYHEIVPQSCGSFCDGLRIAISVWPHQLPNSAINEMKSVVGRYYGNLTYDYFTMLSYMGARTVVDLVRRAGGPDRTKVLEVARSLTAYDTGGFTKPIDISPGRPHPREVIVMHASEGDWQKETDWIEPQA